MQNNSEQTNSGGREGFSTYSMLLRSELLGVEDGVAQYSFNPQSQNQSRGKSAASSSPVNDEKASGRGTKSSACISETNLIGCSCAYLGAAAGTSTSSLSPMTRNLFRFKAERKTTSSLNSSFSLSPLGSASHGEYSPIIPMLASSVRQVCCLVRAKLNEKFPKCRSKC